MAPLVVCDTLLTHTSFWSIYFKCVCVCVQARRAGSSSVKCRNLIIDAAHCSRTPTVPDSFEMKMQLDLEYLREMTSTQFVSPLSV